MRWMLIAAVFAAPLVAHGQEPLAGLEETAFKEAVAKVAPTVVQIQTFGGLDRVGESLTGSGPTSGLVVTTDGYVITSAFNFASKPAAVVVRLFDGRKLDGKIVATDFSRMLTLLKVEASDLPLPESANVEQARVGEWTIAVGKAFDPVRANMSPGVLSAKNRIWRKALQTDAKVSPFNYGGPLVDIHGRVLGVLAPLSMTEDGVMAGADWYDSGIGFAVPIDQVMESAEKLSEGQDLFRGTLGLVTTEPESMFAVPIIAEVRAGSPAASAGFQPKDVIVAIDGRRIARQAETLQALGPKYAGDEVEVTVRRDATEQTFRVTLAKAEKAAVGPEQKPAEQPGKGGEPESESK